MYSITPGKFTSSCRALAITNQFDGNEISTETDIPPKAQWEVVEAPGTSVQTTEILDNIRHPLHQSLMRKGMHIK